jgi:polyhydroxybutyrate depolymerase
MRKTRWLNGCLFAGVAGVMSCSAEDSTTTTGRGSTSGATGGSDATGGNGGAGAPGGSGGAAGSSATGSGGSGGGSTGGTGAAGGSGGSGAAGSGGSGTGGSAGGGTGGSAGKSDAGVADTNTPLPDTSSVDTRTADTNAPGDARDISTTDAGGGGPSDAGPSPGCGLTMTQSGTFMIDVGGTMRSYIVKVPANYNPHTPYPLIFAWHGGGGTATGVASGNYFGMDTTANANGRAIFIAAQGLDGCCPADGMPARGWENLNGRDVAFTRAMIAWASANLCIDPSRIFATGFSWGGMFSNTLGCELPDVFRAVAPMASRLCRGTGPNCSHTATTCMERNVAAWVAHGASDTTVPTSQGRTARDHFLALNHCTMTSTATTPSPCVTYGGCDTGYPVHYCEFDGGHQPPGFAGAGLWSFFSQL